MTRRRRLTLIALPLLLAAALVGREFYWAYHAKPGPPGAGLAAVRVLLAKNQPGPAAHNAWPQFVATLAQVRSVLPASAEAPADWPKDATWPPDISEIRRASPPPHLAAYARRAVQQAQAEGVLDAADALAAEPYFQRELESPSGNLIDVRLPELPDIRALAQLQTARMHLAHAAGDDAQRARAYESILAIVRILDQQATLIDRLVSNQILTTAEQELRTELLEHAASDAALAALQASRARQLPARPSIARVMECERLTTLDIIRMCYTDDGHGDGRLIVTELRRVLSAADPAHPNPPHPLENLRGLVEPGKASTLAKANWIYDELAAAIAKPLPARHTFVQGLETRVAGLEKSGERVLSGLIPALGHAVITDARARGEFDATTIMLAIERYRAAHGEVPEDLSQLVPTLLLSIPSDSITGSPLGYLVPKSGGPPYILYSYGSDAIDNNGATSPTDPFAGYANSNKGFDIVYSLPRR